MSYKKKKIISILIITIIILSNLILLKNVYASEIPLPYGYPENKLDVKELIFSIIIDIDLAISLISIILEFIAIKISENKKIEILKIAYCLINLFIVFNLLKEIYISHWFILISMLIILIVIFIQAIKKIMRRKEMPNGKKKSS